MDVRQLASYIDHTLLKPEATPDDIIRLCHEANEYHFAAVCVNSSYVKLAVEHCLPTVLVASVVGFPLGGASTVAKCAETIQAIADGAREIDMVVHIGLVKARQFDEVRQDIAAVVAAARQVPVKVIIETGALTDEEKVKTCLLAKEAKAAFVKTSTGFGQGPGATVADVVLMRGTVGLEMGVKASGGVRSLERAMEMIAAGANRLGTSSGVAIIKERLGDETIKEPGRSPTY
ncbi:MAG: deoxyribose-phosphate aldolase [bacterium]|nr:deoxyribose-phosphate aldolase [bacterium]